MAIQIVPTPKSLTEGETRVAPRIKWDSEAFSGAAAAFSDYSDRFFGLRFECGDGGLSLAEDASLPKGAYRIDGATIYAACGDGMNRALATVAQTAKKIGSELSLPFTAVSDAPDSDFRGLMVDLARKWHPVSFIYKYVDLCWYYKLDYLQLHFTDDQSYTLPSAAYPRLPTKNRTYSAEELRAVRAYAASRGIELIPEIDMPGHSTVFNEAYPEIFGSQNGIMCAEGKTIDALEALIGEALELFPDVKYFHIGGDEADISKWENCDGCRAFMERNGIANIHELYAEYIRRLTDYVLSRGVTPIVWEGFPKEYNDLIDRRVVVVSWENLYQPVPDLADAGFTLINCAWKPLYVVTPVKMWEPSEIVDSAWGVRTWTHFDHRSPATYTPLTVADDVPVLGAAICAWGDALIPYESCEAACAEELRNLAERVPALAEKTWNDKKCSAEEYLKAYRAVRDRLGM